MTDHMGGMTAEQVRQFLDYVDAEARALEKSRQEWVSDGRIELAGNDKLEMSRLQQTKQMFLKILGR